MHRIEPGVATTWAAGAQECQAGWCGNVALASSHLGQDAAHLGPVMRDLGQDAAHLRWWPTDPDTGTHNADRFGCPCGLLGKKALGYLFEPLSVLIKSVRTVSRN